MIASLELLTFIWTTLFVVFVFHQLNRGHRSAILFVYLIFYGMFAVPLGCDLAFGIPRYFQQPAFFDAAHDPLVRFLYCIFIGVIPILWIKQLPKQDIRDKQQLAGNKVVMSLLFAGMVLPLALLPFAPNPTLYLTYGFVITHELSIAELFFHSIVSAGTVLAVFCGAALLVCSRSVKMALLSVSPLLLIAAWLNGKRAILAVAIVLILLALWYRGALKGRKFAASVVFALLLLAAYSYGYQSQIREINDGSTSKEDSYEALRVDYGRDSRIKTALYAEVNPAKVKILGFRGQSFLFDLTFWIPRDLWPGKPYPYAIYFTSAMLGEKASSLGWGMTTSILDESIANLSWPGLIVGPVIVWFICKTGDSCRNQRVSLLTTVVASLLLAVQLSAFMVLFLIWVFLVLESKYSQRHLRRGQLVIEYVSASGVESWTLRRIRQ